MWGSGGLSGKSRVVVGLARDSDMSTKYCRTEVRLPHSPLPSFPGNYMGAVCAMNCDFATMNASIRFFR